MKTRILRMSALLVTLTFLLLGADLTSTEEKKVEAECCFVHPNYVGICEVAPAEDETCEGILVYLNTQATVGKTYCNSTRIRGGWAKSECPTKE